VLTVLADFICLGILFQIGVLSDCWVRLEYFVMPLCFRWIN